MRDFFKIYLIQELFNDEDGVVQVMGGGSNIVRFLQLLDTPDTYKSQAGKMLRVKSTEDGLEFGEAEEGAVWGTITGTIDNQTDLMNSLNEKISNSLAIAMAVAL